MSAIGKPRPPRPAPEFNGHGSPAVVNAAEVYPLDEAARRLRWRRHSVRQALRHGLVSPKFGSRRYVTGQSILDFIRKLAEQEAQNHKT